MDTFLNAKHIHFIGIGGIGMSALARLFLHEGKSVSGSDAADSAIIEELKKLGAKITIGQAAEHISDDIDVVIYTVAVGADNPELATARRRDLPIFTYAEALGKVSEGKYTVAVAGTHGKTTTTAMIAAVATEAKLSPTVIVGSLLKQPRSNFIAGESDLFIVEACEYKRSFLNIRPNVLVITNIDEDHLDYYKDLADIQSAFIELVKKVPADGFLVCNPSDEKVKPVVAAASCKVIDYATFEQISDLKVPGAHNRANAQAALAVAQCLDVKKEIAAAALKSFAGTWRRFEYKGEKGGVTVYDDYAHHPAEIRATLAGAREFFGPRKIIVVFQPHLYSRTRDLFAGFAAAFHDADEVILAPIYAAREPFDPNISSEMLAEAISQNGVSATSEKNLAAIVESLRRKVHSGDVMLTMGAGDVFRAAEEFLK